jgi:penicillin-binding protein 1A
MALPIWVDYMRAALRGKPDGQRPLPDGLVQANGDWAYQEFAEQGAVRTVGMEESDPIRNLWNRIFGGGNNAAPAGAGQGRRQADQQAVPPQSLP